MSVVVLAVYFPTQVLGATIDKTLRNNGADWIVFGPAIITRCQRVDLHIVDNIPARHRRFTVVKGDTIFDTVKGWISVNIDDKLNLSPEKPRYDAVMAGNHLVLRRNYPFRFPVMGNCVALYASPKGQQADLLLLVPLNTQTLGGAAGCRKKQDEIKKIFVLKQSLPKYDDAERAMEGGDLVTVVYPVRDLPLGVPIKKEDLEARTIDFHHLPHGAINNEWIAIGRTPKYGVAAGQIIEFADLGLTEEARETPMNLKDRENYQRKICQCIREHWTKNPDFVRLVVVVFQIQPDGSFTKLRLVTSSGSAKLDKAAMTAVQLTGTLPKPPAELNAPVNVQVHFENDVF